MQPELFGIPTYFIYLSLLFSVLVLILPKWAKKNKASFPDAINLAMIIMVSGFIGARLFHVFYENFEIYQKEPIKILEFWYGGFVFYGGAITAFICSVIYIKKKNLNFNQWADFWAPLVALGYGLGRVACLLSGCCYGRACDLPWAISGRHPTQLYASIWELSVFAFLLIIQPKLKKQGSLFFIWLSLHTLGRLVMEYFRDDFRGELYLSMSISTWISLILFSISLAVLIFPRLLLPRQ